MIYFDNAATSFPKPKRVIEAVTDCLTNYCANPGRSGHQLALKAGRAVYEAREAIADFFNIDDPLRVIFTSGATEALNLALKGALRKGDHVLTTSMEHNSVLRPLSRLQADAGVEVSILECSREGLVDLAELERAIRPNTKMVACTHASNLTGTIMPVKEIGGLCRRRGLLFLVDAAQSAGVLDIDVQDLNIDLLAVPGHKGLMGMQGAGFLYVGARAEAELAPLKEGGTGSRSEQTVQPGLMPDKYESGTLNLPGIVSIQAGLTFIKEVGLAELRRHNESLTRMFLDGLKNIPNATVYGRGSPGTAVIAVNLGNISSSEFAAILDEEFGICTRAGLHCAPLAHKTMGTLESAAVRFSFDFFNTEAEIGQGLEAIAEISKR